MDKVNPDYYKFKLFGNIDFELFDLVDAINNKCKVSFRIASALKYIIRIKEDTPEKRINDLQKAIDCINKEIEYINRNNVTIKISNTAPDPYGFVKGVTNIYNSKL